MQQIARLKNNIFYLSLSMKHKDLTRKLCVYFLIHWFSGEDCMFLFSLHKGRQTSKELKKKETWMMELLFFWCLYLSSFLLKKRRWHRCFLWILWIFWEPFFNRIPLGSCFWLLTYANLKSLYWWIFPPKFSQLLVFSQKGELSKKWNLNANRLN